MMTGKSMAALCAFFALLMAGCAFRTGHPVSGENLANVSWGDNIVAQSGVDSLDTPEKLATAFQVWKENYQVETVLWRISSEYIRRFYVNRTKGFERYYDKIDEIMTRFDPAKTAREEAHRNGQKLLLYATFNDHGMPAEFLYADDAPFPWQDKMTIEHPEYQERALDGGWQYGVLDLSVPAARKFMVERLASFVQEYQADGLYLCSRSHIQPAEHGDRYGFGPTVVTEYQRRYGIDVTQDKRFDYRSPMYDQKAPELEAWRRLRGEYLLVFLKELRQALRGKHLYLAIPVGPYLGPPFGNLRIDHEGIVKEHLVDGVIYGVVSGRFLYPKRRTPHAELGYLCSDEDNYNVLSRPKAIAYYSQLCHANGVKCFFNTPSHTRDIDPRLDGVMFSAPSANPGLRVVGETLYTPSMTVEGFFKLGKGQRFPGLRLVSRYSHESEETRGWELYRQEDGKIRFRTNLIALDGSVTDDALESTTQVSFDQWFHVTAIFDCAKAEKKLYVNGRLEARRSFTPGVRLRNNQGIDLHFGSYGIALPSEAAFDEVALWDFAKEQISVPTTPYLGNEKGLRLLFHFNGDAAPAYLAPGLRLEQVGRFLAVPGRIGQAASNY